MAEINAKVIEDMRANWRTNPAMPAWQRLVFDNICNLALSALTRPRDAGVVGVKGLEWRGSNYADTPFGEYTVELDEDDDVAATPWCAWSPAEDGTNLGHFATPKEAEAECQADYDARIRSALAVSPPPGAMEGWQDIATAPKDGTTVQLGFAAPERESWVAQGRFVEDAGWYETNNHPTDAWGGEIYPTHWMPLPAAPQSGSAKE